MSSSADGSVIIEVNADTKEAEKKVDKLAKDIKKAASPSKKVKTLTFDMNLSDVQKKLAGLNKGIDAVEKKLGAFYGDTTDKKYRRLAATLERLKEHWVDIARSSREASNIAMGRPASGTVKRKKNSAWEREAKQDIKKITEDFGNTEHSAKEAEKAANGLKEALEEAGKTLADLEERGKWFGDPAYDRAFQNFARIAEEAKIYRKELLEPSKPQNPFGLDTIAGKLKEAQLELSHLEALGKSLGDQDFDKAYRGYSLLLAEAKEYRKQLAKTPAQEQREAEKAAAAEERRRAKEQRAAEKAAAAEAKRQAKIDKEAAAAEEAAKEEQRIREIKESVRVEDQRIVDLNEELLALKKRQKELEALKIGYGIEEYDQNYARIKEITKELKEYQKALSNTESASEQAAKKMDSILGKMSDSMSKGNAAGLEGMRAAIKSISGGMRSLFSGAEKSVKAVMHLGKTAAKAFSLAAMGATKLLGKINIFPKMFNSIGLSLKKLGSLIKQALVFSVVYKGLSLVREQMGAYLSVNTQFMTALRRLQGVLLTAFQPIYEVVVPALTSLINVLSRAIATVTQFFAALFGKTASQAQTNAKDLYEQANATAAAGSAAEEASKQMAAFDEINQLTENKSSSGGGGGASAETGPLFDWEYEDTPFDSWGEAFSAFLDKLIAGVPELEKALMGFADRLNNFAKKLYDMFKFPGVLDKVKQLGKDLADMMNHITDAIEWELIGRALGAGLNLALNFLTSFIYRYNWENLGKHLAEFINGLVDEIDWYEFGRLLWAGFKIGLETLAGFLLGLNMPALAEAASKIVKGFFTEMINTIQRIPWDQIGLQIATFINSIDWVGTLSVIAAAITLGINAAITTLGALIGNLEWVKIGEAVAAAFNLLISEIDWAGIGNTLSEAFEGALVFLYTALSNFDWEAFGSSIGEFLVSIDWLKILTLLFDVIQEIIFGLLESLLSAIQTFWENADPFERMLLAIAVAVGVVGVAITTLIGIGTAAFNMFRMLQTAIQGVQLLFGLLPSPIGLVVLAITAAIATIAVLITHFDGLREVAQQAWEGIKGAFGEAAAWLNENVITPFVDGYNEHIKPVLDTFIEKLTEVVEEHVVPMAEKAMEVFGKLFEALQRVWDTILGPLVAWIVENAVPQIGNALEFAGEVFSNLLSTVSDVVSGILQALGGVIDFLVGVFTGDWDRAWNGLVDIFKGVWNAIVSALEGAVNLIISGINFLIGALNKLHIDIPDNPITGSFTLGFNIPKLSEISIPRLAQGAVIPPNREFLAVLGDQRSGTNIEAPVSEIENAVARGIQAAGGLGGNRNITIILQVDKREFARAVYNANNDETQRVGVRLTETRK